MNWATLLGLLSLSSLRARWHGLAQEGRLAVTDRLALARLEWQQQRQHLAKAVVLLVLLTSLFTVALLLLALALLVQFWDTPQRTQVAWLLAGAALLGCTVLAWWLRRTLNQASDPFALTRHELAQDWHTWQTLQQHTAAAQAGTAPTPQGPAEAGRR